MTGSRRRSLGALLALAVGSILVMAAAQACGLDANGSRNATTAPPPDATTDDRAALPDLDAMGMVDASEGPCPAVATVIPDGGERMVFAVHRRAGARCTSFVLDRTTAATERTDDGGVTEATARVSLEWDESALYVGVDVDDPLVQGLSPEPERNDSVEIYASGFGTIRTGDYLQFDHHYIVDHAGLSIDVTDVALPKPFLGSKVATTPKGYRVEARIAAADLGGPLAAGQMLWFDMLLNDNDGTSQAKYLIWAMTPHATCACASCQCNGGTPTFDTLLFAPFTLVP